MMLPEKLHQLSFLDQVDTAAPTATPLLPAPRDTFAIWQELAGELRPTVTIQVQDANFAEEISGRVLTWTDWARKMAGTWVKGSAGRRVILTGSAAKGKELPREIQWGQPQVRPLTGERITIDPELENETAGFTQRAWPETEDMGVEIHLEDQQACAVGLTRRFQGKQFYSEIKLDPAKPDCLEITQCSDDDLFAPRPARYRAGLGVFQQQLQVRVRPNGVEGVCYLISCDPEDPYPDYIRFNQTELKVGLAMFFGLEPMLAFRRDREVVLVGEELSRREQREYDLAQLAMYRAEVLKDSRNAAVFPQALPQIARRQQYLALYEQLVATQDPAEQKGIRDALDRLSK